MAEPKQRKLRELERVAAKLIDTGRQRDRLIIEARAAGANAPEVATAAGLTRGRIYQIEKESAQ